MVTQARGMRSRHMHLHRPRIAAFNSIPEQSSTTLPQAGTAVLVAREVKTSVATTDAGGVNPTIPIAVGICVPLVVIIVTFIWLHRRHVKKTRAEEKFDPHKSLDFGLVTKPKDSGSGKEMGQVEFEKSLRNGRGLSMDIGSPYLLPPELQNSRESLNSLSRNIVHEAHDPYRQAFLASSANSIRESALGDDNASFRTGSTMRTYGQDNSRSPLVSNAQRMPFSTPTPPPIAELPQPVARLQTSSPLATAPVQKRPSVDMDKFVPPPPAAYMPNEPAKRTSPKPPSPQQSLPKPPSPPPQQALPKPPSPPTQSVPQITVGNDYDDDYYDESDYIQQPVPRRHEASPHSESSEQFFTPTEETHHAIGQASSGLGVSNIPFENRRISVLRPLPPDDPSDTPQQRAQRIRSFYKEYFNENDARIYQQGPQDYYEDYGSEYLGDGAVYDQVTGQFVVGGAPFAQPIHRRAMTPPPRGPPRFQPGSRHTSAGSSPAMHGRARAFSSASASQMRGRQPRRNAPPPTPLRTLPTPHLLKEDAFALPIDFAPPGKIRDQAAGRSASPTMQSRPFSPQVAIASPLQSSFNELPSMPSPHHLRRSGTFTALDFAPPPRFKDRSDTGSDNGSIRSGRSNHSTSSRLQVHNIRNGAYRVSRIPKELVGTQGETLQSLRPTWKVGS